MRCIISSYFSNILIITTFLYIIIIFFYFSNIFIIITFLFVMNIFIIIILKKTPSRDLLLPRRVESTPLISGSSTQHMWELLAGTPWQFSHGIRGVGVSEVTPDLCASKYNKSNLKQGAHILQTAAWPAPHACAQLYHPGSGSHGQLFRPYMGSSAWHSRRV